MRNPFIFAMMLLLGISAANSQTKRIRAGQDAKAEQEVRKLEREWLEAGRNKDVTTMDRILADDFIITFGDGSTRDKVEVMRRLHLGTKNPNEYDWTEDSKVRTYGDTAIITGKYMYKVQDKDKEMVSESRYTDTYIKLNGRWQVVASHLSNVAKK